MGSKQVASRAVSSTSKSKKRVCKKNRNKSSVLSLSVQGRKGKAFLRGKIQQSAVLALDGCRVPESQRNGGENKFLSVIATGKILGHLANLPDDRSTTIPKNPNDEFADLSLNDLDFLNTLGVGGFGRVSLVFIRGDPTRTFALKKMKKVDIVEMQQEVHILSEKKVMNEVNCEFIVKLHQTFKDNKYLYMLLESCLGGELWSILQRRKYFPEPVARFYTACVVKALEHLHSKNIIYRDLKPENLLLDHRGYLKVADFGFAKKLDLNEQTLSFCGTPEYMAPEVIMNTGHDVRCDYWSLGVLIFELLMGRPPFSAPDMDPNRTYYMILKGFDPMNFPDAISREGKALIFSLCQRQPADRLGGENGDISQIETDLWFHGFDWDALIARTMVPPILPVIKNVMDTSNFDSYPPDANGPPADDLTGWDADF